MTVLRDEWKINPNLKGEKQLLPTAEFGNIKQAIEERGDKFKNKSYHLVQSNILREEAFLKERTARANLLNNFIHYESVLNGSLRSLEGNYYLSLSETWKKIMDELNKAVNDVFSLKINGKKLIKRKGESLEHYFMRHAILEHLNEAYGVKDFQEEYSKLKEVFENYARGDVAELEWEKIAKRADLYVVLNDRSKQWIEVERTTSNSELNKKLKRLGRVLSHFPNLFDKVVFVFPALLPAMAEATLTEAIETGFPEDKLDFYEINFLENRIVHLDDAYLVKVEFGDRMLDMIADGHAEPKKKTAKLCNMVVKEKIIIPLINREWSDEYVKSKKDKIKRLISFWRRHTRKLPFGKKEEIEESVKESLFKDNALKKIKNYYPYLLK